MSMTLQLICVISGVLDLYFPHDIVKGEFTLTLDLKKVFLIQILASVNIKNTVPLKTVVRGRCHWQVWQCQAVHYDRWRHLEHTLYTSLLGEHCVLVITTCGRTDRRQTIRHDKSSSSLWPDELTIVTNNLQGSIYSEHCIMRSEKLHNFYQF